MTTLVRKMMNALEEDGFANVEFAETGGGCKAIRITWDCGHAECNDQHYPGEVLITGEDVFSYKDLDSDDDVNGEWYAGFYCAKMPEGTEIVYVTPSDDPDADIQSVITQINYFILTKVLK